MRTVSSADANRYFSSLLREVKEGGTIVITSRGEAVARLVPLIDSEHAGSEKEAERQRAWKEHIARLRAQSPLNIPMTWTRDDIYDPDF